MSIVLNEYEWAKEAVKNRELGKKPSETLMRIAKYYYYDGYSKKDVAVLLRDQIIRSNPSGSIERWTSLIDWVVKTAYKNPPVMIDNVPVTELEMKKIKEVNGKQCQRLAFTLLCIAKFNHMARCIDYWVNTPDSEIMKMANIGTSIRRQSALFGQLKDAGLIRFSKKIDNLSVQVLFADNLSPAAVLVHDFRNLGYQLSMYLGEDCFECQRCGLTTKHNKGSTKREKYCRDCAKLIQRQQNRESAARSYERKVSAQADFEI